MAIDLQQITKKPDREVVLEVIGKVTGAMKT